MNDIAKCGPQSWSEVVTISGERGVGCLTESFVEQN